MILHTFLAGQGLKFVEIFPFALVAKRQKLKCCFRKKSFGVRKNFSGDLIAILFVLICCYLSVMYEAMFILFFVRAFHLVGTIYR